MVSSDRGGADVAGVSEPAIADEDNLAGGWLIGSLLERWRLMFCLGLVFGALGVAASFLVDKTYRVTTLVTMAEGDKLKLPSALSSSGLGDLAALAGLAPPAGEDRSEALAILQSDLFLGRFIETHKLTPELFPRRWDSAAAAWKGGLLGSPPTRKEAVRKFRKKALKLEEERKTGLITIGVVWAVPASAADIANALVSDVNEMIRARRIHDSQTRVAALQEQLDTTVTTEVRTALFSLLQQELRTITIAKTRKDFALIVLDPAQSPDEYDRVGPQRFVWLFAGGVCGGIIGTLIVLFGRLRSARRS